MKIHSVSQNLNNPLRSVLLNLQPETPWIVRLEREYFCAIYLRGTWEESGSKQSSNHVTAGTVWPVKHVAGKSNVQDLHLDSQGGVCARAV